MIRALDGAPAKSRGYPKMDSPFLLFWLRGGKQEAELSYMILSRMNEKQGKHNPE